MNEKTWGVIYSPKEGTWRTRRRWKHICDYLTQKGQPFDFVQSEGPGSVERLAAMLTTNGYRTIVVVGGDAALGDALNGIISATPKGTTPPTLGTIPNGIVNDFAHFWNMIPSDYERNIDALMRGCTRLVDVGEATLTTIAGHTIRRHFINCINVGLAASIIKLRRRNQSFWRGTHLLSELCSAFMLLWHRHSTRITFALNNETQTGIITTLCIGSCSGFGQTPSAVPYNGLLDVSAVKRPPLIGTFTALALLFNRRFLSQKGISVWRTTHIRLFHIGRTTVSIDGHAIHHRITQLSATLHKEAIPFLIP